LYLFVKEIGSLMVLSENNKLNYQFIQHISFLGTLKILLGCLNPRRL
jgi:hypothetical protein